MEAEIAVLFFIMVNYKMSKCQAPSPGSQRPGRHAIRPKNSPPKRCVNIKGGKYG
ncbi:hypothetical protein ES705_08891 [subsurface metagenome]